MRLVSSNKAELAPTGSASCGQCCRNPALPERPPSPNTKSITMGVIKVSNTGPLRARYRTSFSRTARTSPGSPGTCQPNGTATWSFSGKSERRYGLHSCKEAEDEDHPDRAEEPEAKWNHEDVQPVCSRNRRRSSLRNGESLSEAHGLALCCVDVLQRRRSTRRSREGLARTQGHPL